MRHTYRVNEIFRSIQGEGVRAGTPVVFVRFSGCNLTCRRITEGFDCDTEFVSGLAMTLDDLVAQVDKTAGPVRSVILTGGEPALQVDVALVDALHGAGFHLAIETNGTVELPNGIDWITVSPKTAEHTMTVSRADEVKYVRRAGQGIPKPSIEANHYLISPAFTPYGVDQADLEWCFQLCMDNPRWRLSLQLHKVMGVR